ncbi:MAG: hypothetical protein IIC35_00660 [Gemmatimonadetes bacterium]|nr:hypothetical protein [Gemmatimonadota bacterium]
MSRGRGRTNEFPRRDRKLYEGFRIHGWREHRVRPEGYTERLVGDAFRIYRASSGACARLEAIQRAAEPQIEGTVVAAAAVLLAAVIAWDVHVMTRPQNMPLPADEAVDLRWFLADAVELIENFRAEEGRLPSRADLGDLLGDSFSLEIRGQMYVIGLEGAGTSVRYDGSVPLDEWVLGAGPVGAQGDAP